MWAYLSRRIDWQPYLRCMCALIKQIMHFTCPAPAICTWLRPSELQGVYPKYQKSNMHVHLFDTLWIYQSRRDVWEFTWTRFHGKKTGLNVANVGRPPSASRDELAVRCIATNGFTLMLRSLIGCKKCTNSQGRRRRRTQLAACSDSAF